MRIYSETANLNNLIELLFLSRTPNVFEERDRKRENENERERESRLCVRK